MIERNWTEGEWKASQVGDQEAKIFCPAGWWICTFWKTEDDQDISNATLMAASKELYEALSACAAKLEEVDPEDVPCHEEYAQAMAALAKARGE